MENSILVRSCADHIAAAIQAGSNSLAAERSNVNGRAVQ
jgi:hypothetical protein